MGTREEAYLPLLPSVTTTLRRSVDPQAVQLAHTCGSKNPNGYAPLEFFS
jgi:hypothetical protein